MKNIVTGSGMMVIVLSLLLCSCVSKKKYTEAQAAIEKYRSDSAECAARSATLQQSLSSMEANSRNMKSQMDSSRRNASRYQKRWDEFQTYYDQRTKSSEDLRTQVNTALSGSGITEENVQATNGWVIITLPKEMLFTSGTNLSSTGKAALVKIANLVESNDDYSVDVATGDSYASFAKRMENRGDRMNRQSRIRGNDGDTSMRGQDSSRRKMSDTSMMKGKRRQGRHMADSSMAKTQQDKDTSMAGRKMSRKDKSGNAGSAMDNRSIAASRAGGAENWGNDLSRATAIVKVLAQNGAAEVRLLAPTYSQTRNTVTTDPIADKGYYVILTPKMHKMEQMMEGNKQN